MITATEIFCLHELGKRPNNEDYISPQRGTATLNDRLFIVCDGVGGENKGEVASEIVCTSIYDYVNKQAIGRQNEKAVLQKAIQFANEQLATYSKQNPDAKRMSTTLALVLLGESSVTAAWCGDTRIHHIRNGEICWRSKDHSLVSELVSQGELTEEEARHHPRRNVITRSLNALSFNNAVDFYEINNFKTGDYLLLCTDGLLENINDKIIYNILSSYNDHDKINSFQSYCENKTRDNYSMYLIRCEYKPGKKPWYRTYMFLFFVTLLLLSCLILVFLKIST